jgi:hypothetical protein
MSGAPDARRIIEDRLADATPVTRAFRRLRPRAATLSGFRTSVAFERERSGPAGCLLFHPREPHARGAAVPRIHGRTTTIGSRGREVLKLEHRLDRLGYSPGKVDGVSDRDTFEAAKDFKASHKGFSIGENSRGSRNGSSRA